MDAETFNQVLDLIQMLIIIVAMIFLYRSVPAAQIEKLFIRLEENARKTATPVDDTMVGLGRLVTTLLTGQMPGQLAPSTPAGQPASQPQPVPVTVTGIVTATPAAPVAFEQADTQLTADNQSAG